MKVHLLFAIAALAAIAPLFAQSIPNLPGGAAKQTPIANDNNTTLAGGSVSKATVVVINPPGQGSQNGITGTNGNYNSLFPNYAASHGTIRIKQKVGDLTHSEARCDNGVYGQIVGLEDGDVVYTSVNSSLYIEGTGSEVYVGSGSNALIRNTATPGPTAKNITVHIGTGSFAVMPGMLVPCQG